MPNFNPEPTLYGFKYRPLPNAMLSNILLCLDASSNCSLADFTSFKTLTTPETPPVRAPKALKPAKIGMSGKAPPFFFPATLKFLES